jgi:hypothetical protein
MWKCSVIEVIERALGRYIERLVETMSRLVTAPTRTKMGSMLTTPATR